MQSCSLHHCVLFFLILTFTTAPVSAAVCSTTVKLHEPVTLPCEHKCDGRAKWTLTDDNRDVVLAECNKTSCSSLKKGFNMSHDKYKRGDLSLIITAADYSMRNTYTCECGLATYTPVSLSIETVFSTVLMKSDEDLILDLSVPELVEVIYKSSDSAAGEQICNVTQHTLQCTAEYTHRTSLSHRELTLRGVWRSDSGSYTVRDMKSNEEIRIYSVSMTGLYKSEITLIVLSVLVMSGFMAVIMYRKFEDYKVEKRKKAVNDLFRQVRLEHPDPIGPSRDDNTQIKLEAVKRAKKAIDDLEKDYKDNRIHSEHIELFCGNRRHKLKLYEDYYSTNTKSEECKTEREVLEMTEEVVKVLEFFNDQVNNKKGSLVWPDSQSSEGGRLMKPRTTFIDMLSLKYSHGNLCLLKIKRWCMKKREEEKNMEHMNTFLDTCEEWYEEKKKQLEEYEQKLQIREYNPALSTIEESA